MTARTSDWKRLWCVRKGKGPRALRRQWLTGILLQRGSWTVAQIAETLGVSKATCQRDLDLLADLFDVQVTGDLNHRQRAHYRMIGTFKPTISAFPLRMRRQRARKHDRRTS
jgi:hypothetical protein